MQIALQNTFPEINWIPWKFHSVSPQYWDEVKHREQFFRWLGEKMEITDLAQWYKLPVRVVHENVQSNVSSILPAREEVEC